VPNYDWECERCGFKFEKVVTGGHTVIPCPACGLCLAYRIQPAPAFKIIGGTPKFHNREGKS
jgi:putative FmdB family regulatory protein